MNTRIPRALKNAKDELFDWASRLTEIAYMEQVDQDRKELKDFLSNPLHNYVH